ncbi:MAG: DUF4919 domain-containing protein [Bacteroidetes bacterium]|nr:DUF4919 domain-containing protein [Bacteroidota bacterium]
MLAEHSGSMPVSDKQRSFTIMSGSMPGWLFRLCSIIILPLMAILISSAGVHNPLHDGKHKPDYKLIEKNIKRKNSGFYYPELIARFNEGDTTLNLHEKVHLYFGFVFQEHYRPYSESSVKTLMNNIPEKDIHQKASLEKIVFRTDSILNENPFNLNALDYALFALDELHDYSKFNKRLFQARSILEAILHTGDGLSIKTCYYVISPSHEYHVLGYLGYRFGGVQSLIGNCDRLSVESNADGIEGLYFDVTPCFNHLSSIFNDLIEQKR